jgi:2-polyprenyl-3-methyl-5-hydroxy-6-metoxy-1,4-benzoquinol methylase
MDSFVTLKPEWEPFRRHYEDDTSHWGKNSGGGSDSYFTIEYRCFLDKFIAMNGVRSIVDIGCGDWQFSRFLNLDGVRYSGFDVVPSVVERNRHSYGSRDVEFSIMPSRLEDVPPADLLIMKDVLQHLPNDAIFDFSEKVFPRFTHCLLTNSYQKLNSRQNIDITYGNFRCLDLTSPPFSFSGSYVLEFSSPLWERIRTFLYIGT